MARKREGYHHGDLRRAILDAGEAELAERGRHGFSLRRVAARVGVSHTAPAHHFRDVSGLLEALATRGFERLLDCMQRRQSGATGGAYDRLVSSGCGYLDFALGQPALFRLVFGLDATPVAGSPLQTAGRAAFDHLADAVAALRNADPQDPALRVDVLASWTRVHGFAELVISGYVDAGPDMDAATETLFRAVFAADLDGPEPGGPTG